VQCSVLYFDRDTRTLQAWDNITLGGLGLTSAEIERKVVEPATEPGVDPEDGQPAPTRSLLKPDGVPYAFRVPDGLDAVGLRPHRLVAQDAALSRR
jgi:hypothetical protein